MQEAFERAYHRWGALREMERPDLWVQRVALNLATSQLPGPRPQAGPPRQAVRRAPRSISEA